MTKQHDWRRRNENDGAMTFLFFDTETTGLPKFSWAPGWLLPNWPRAVQLGWVLTDRHGVELHSDCRIIRPSGFTFPPESIAIHGITQEIALREGDAIDVVLADFCSDVGDSEVCVAHNVRFDIGVLTAELVRLGKPNCFRNRSFRCTMRETTQYCGLPRGKKLKWPSLKELYRILFDCDITLHHNALADARSCAQCFWELKRLGVM